MDSSTRLSRWSRALGHDTPTLPYRQGMHYTRMALVDYAEHDCIKWAADCYGCCIGNGTLTQSGEPGAPRGFEPLPNACTRSAVELERRLGRRTPPGVVSAPPPEIRSRTRNRTGDLRSMNPALRMLSYSTVTWISNMKRYDVNDLTVGGDQRRHHLHVQRRFLSVVTGTGSGFGVSTGSTGAVGSGFGTAIAGVVVAVTVVTLGLTAPVVSIASATAASWVGEDHTHCRAISTSRVGPWNSCSQQPPVYRPTCGRSPAFRSSPNPSRTGTRRAAG